MLVGILIRKGLPQKKIVGIDTVHMNDSDLLLEEPHFVVSAACPRLHDTSKSTNYVSSKMRTFIPKINAWRMY